jgi:archaemetzincin
MRFNRYIVWLFLLVLACRSQPSVPNKKVPNGKPGIAAVLIQPLDDVDAATIAYLQKQLSDSFHKPIVVLPFRSMPRGAWYAPRKRFWADSLLQWLKPLSKDTHQKVLGVTGKDISTRMAGKPNWGVMGLAYVPGHVCVVSDYRLQQHGISAVHIRQKLLKVALHELGHTAGLAHCSLPFCLMADAKGKDNLDSLHGYCYNCRRLLFGQ